MGFFKSKEEREQARDRSQEKKAYFEGETLQIVGRIPNGASVKLTLKPDEQVLNINHERINITLPYKRIMRFHLERELSPKQSKGKELAASVLQSGILGRGIVGKVGRVAGNLIPQTNEMSSIAILSYIDKEGNEQELRFLRKYLIEHEVFEDTVEDKDHVADEFESVLNRIIFNIQGKNINEL